MIIPGMYPVRCERPWDVLSPGVGVIISGIFSVWGDGPWGVLSPSVGSVLIPGMYLVWGDHFWDVLSVGWWSLGCAQPWCGERGGIISGVCSVWGDGPWAVPGVLRAFLGCAPSRQAWGEHPSRRGCFSTFLAVAAAAVSPDIPAVPWPHTLCGGRGSSHRTG